MSRRIHTIYIVLARPCLTHFQMNACCSDKGLYAVILCHCMDITFHSFQFVEFSRL